MGIITLPNVRATSDITIRVRLKDGGLAIDWSGLNDIKAYIFSDVQRSIAGRCAISVDGSDSTVLVCEYSATKPQYIGVNSIVIRATYHGRIKTYDKKVFNIVHRTDDVSGDLVLDDPVVDLELDVEDVSSSILDNILAACVKATEEAQEIVDIHRGPQGEPGPQGETGATGATPAFTIGTVTTGAAGSQAAATITGTPAEPVLNLTIPKGDQGNTGSSIDYPYELVNNLTTNDATKGLSAAMGVQLEGEVSQLEHEVSNIPLLEKVVGNVINFAEETLVDFIINNSTGQWQVGSSGTPRFCYIISAQGLQGKRIYVNTNSVNNSRIAFLTTNAHINATAADFCSGYSGTIRLRAGAVVDAVIPSDCNYIYIGVQSGSSDISAKSVWTSGDDSKEPLNFLGYMKKISGQYISSSTHEIAASSAGTIYLVKPYGSKKVFTHIGASDSGMMSVAFYSTDEISAEGYMSGLTSASGHTIGEMEIPDGCKLIAISNRASICANPEARLDDNAMMNYPTDASDGIIGEKVNLDDLTIKGYYISPSSNKWSSGGTSYLIPVSEGQKMYIRANQARSARYAFLTTDTIVEDATPSYVASTELMQIIKGNYDVATIPAGCTHLYIYATYSTYVFIPEAIILGGQITELAEDLKKNDGPVSPFSGKKILCIGDSWGRDSFEELWSVANDAGVSVEVYDAYQGGSSLLNQYKGMDDATRHYTHGNYEQYVQGTYQLWNWSENLPSKTPTDSVYHNGKCGINDGTAYGKDANNEWAGMTLAEILASQDWDIINIRLGVGDLQTIDKLTTTDDDKGYFVLANFITRMEAELTPACLAKVKWSISNCWSWPVESAGYYTPSARVLADAGIDADWASMTLAQKQEAFVTFYNNIQKNFQLIAKALGDKCAYIVNTAKALQLGRDSHLLGDVAFKMVRSSTDMHLGNGIPKYICGCCFAYNYLAITCGGIFGDYVPDLIDGSGNSDGGVESNPTTPTKALCAGARMVGWKSFGDL